MFVFKVNFSIFKLEYFKNGKKAHKKLLYLKVNFSIFKLGYLKNGNSVKMHNVSTARLKRDHQL